VAERARVPLFVTSAGLLGTDPSSVETTLTHDFELCRLWNAMLLLDEADVFLGARLEDSLQRNELVSGKPSVPPIHISYLSSSSIMHDKKKKKN
jgi:hypothetical protein